MQNFQSEGLKPFTCPVCFTPVPFSKVWLLNNNSVYCCEVCKNRITPEKMGTWYFALAFVFTGATGRLLLGREYPVLSALAGAALIGAVVYLVVVVYTYKKVFFKRLD